MIKNDLELMVVGGTSYPVAVFILDISEGKSLKEIAKKEKCTVEALSMALKFLAKALTEIDPEILKYYINKE